MSTSWPSGTCQALLHLGDRRPRVGAPTDHDNATDRLPLAVPLGQPAPNLRSDGDVRHLLEQDGNPPRSGAQHDVLQITDLFHVAATADHKLALRHLHQTAPHLDVGTLDGRPHFVQRQPVGAQAHRVDLDLVLADEAADGSDLGDAFDRREPVLEVPVLKAPQLGQRAAVRVEHVHEGPADAGGVGAELRRDAPRQLVGQPG
jgi:hypothetical protein